MSAPLELLVDGVDGATAALALAHGAGAGMRHPFMAALAAALAAEKIATARYEFAYARAGGGFTRIDPEPVLVATVAEAIAAARTRVGGLPLFAGGKSMGGRMTTRAAAQGKLAGLGVRGIALVGFPLHPAKKPSTTRAEHLADVAVPLLFLAGTRDALSELDLLRGVVGPLGARATLEVIEGADHGFALLARHRGPEPVEVHLARLIRAWIDHVLRDGASKT